MDSLSVCESIQLNALDNYIIWYLVLTFAMCNFGKYIVNMFKNLVNVVR